MEMDILEKCAYIKGLMDGLNIDTTKPEGKVLSAMADLLSDICETVADIDDEVATLGDYIEEVDHDLGEVEEYLCEDEDYMEATCPSCGEAVCFDGELELEDLICPACGKSFADKE